jgi:DNA-binding PadR family transcriptional regulator
MAIEAGRELLILGILRRTPMSAYDLSRAVKMHGSLYRNLGRGNVYVQLSHLAQGGAISERRAGAARGPRDTKAMYALTAAGRRRFDALMREVMSDVQISDATLEVACVLLGQLTRETAREHLAARLEAIVAQERRLERLFGKREERSAAGELALTHAIARLRGEIAWLRESIALLRGAKWRTEWRSNDDATGRGRRLP